MHFCNGRIRLSKNEKYQCIRFALKTKDRTNCNYSTIKIIVYVIPLYTIFPLYNVGGYELNNSNSNSI